MKYVKQFGIIILISFVGEVLNYLIPLPITTAIGIGVSEELGGHYSRWSAAKKVKTK